MFIPVHEAVFKKKKKKKIAPARTPGHVSQTFIKLLAGEQNYGTDFSKFLNNQEYSSYSVIVSMWYPCDGTCGTTRSLQGLDQFKW